MKKNSKPQRCVEHLLGLDRAALAVLRRSVRDAPGAHPPAFPYVEPFLAGSIEEGPRERAERTAYYLVAALFALKERPEVPPKRIDGDFGASAALLYHKRDRTPSIERRFINLLDADREQLPYRPRQLVSLLKADDMPVDWARLTSDLVFWAHPDRLVQQRWARAFYRASATAEAAGAEPTLSPASPLEPSTERSSS